jgi:hypothetical protein
MKHRPVLDPDFVPAVLWNRSYAAKTAKTPGSKPLVISLERGDSTVSVYRTTVLPHTKENSALNIRYVERLLKFLLWQRGGYKVLIAGEPEIAARIKAIYSPGGARAFDHEFMGRKVYGRRWRWKPATWMPCRNRENCPSRSGATSMAVASGLISEGATGNARRWWMAAPTKPPL